MVPRCRFPGLLGMIQIHRTVRVGELITFFTMKIDKLIPSFFFNIDIEEGVMGRGCIYKFDTGKG